MNIKNNFSLMKTENGAVIMSDDASLPGFIRINATGIEIWEGILSGWNIEQIARSLNAKYDISIEAAVDDVADFVQQLNQLGIVE